MKIVLNKEKFINTLAIGSAFAGKSKLIHILDNVKVKIKQGQLSVVSSDGENYISRKMTDGVDSEGDIVFCFEPFGVLSYIKSLYNDAIELDVKDRQVEIVHESGSFNIPVSDSNDFPQRKSETDTIDLNISATVLRSWFADGKDFVSYNDQLRPILSGIHLYKMGDELGCCATDGISLFTDNMQDGSINGDFKVTINPSCFKPIMDAFKSSESIGVRIGGTSLLMKNADTTMMCALQEGRYPNFKSVIGSATGSVKVYVSKKDMVRTLNRCSLGANMLNYVELTVKNGNMELLSSDNDFNKGVSEMLQAETEIEGEFKIAFKINILMKILGKINSDKIYMCMNKPNTPCFIREWPNPTNTLYMLMPFNIG